MWGWGYRAPVGFIGHHRGCDPFQSNSSRIIRGGEMPFFPDQDTIGADVELARMLRRFLLLKGIPVSDTAVQRWAPLFKRLIEVRGEQAIRDVLNWYGPQCDDPWLPSVQSPKALSSKWERLMAHSGLELRELDVDQSVSKLIMKRPLHWPFPEDGNVTQAAWCQEAYNGISRDSQRHPVRVQRLMGPIIHVVSLWRHEANTAAFTSRPSSFNEIRYRPGADYHFNKIIRSVK